MVTIPRIEPPRLRAGSEDRSRHATWLELFYDLVFVVAIAELAHELSSDVSRVGVLTFVVLFVPVWWAWIGSTFYATRFDTDDIQYRVLTAVEMVAVVGLAVNVHDGLSTNSARFALAYAAIRGILVVKYLRAYRHVPQARPLTRRYAAGFGIGAGLWVLSAVVPPPFRYGLWACGLAVSFLTPITASRLHVDFAPNAEHLPERFGLFIIIVLGESFVGIVNAIGERPTLPGEVVVASLAVALAVSLWWLYFEHITERPIELARETGHSWMYQVWLYAHLPLTIALAAVGVGIEHVAHTQGPPGVADRWLLAGGVGLYFASLGALMLTAIRFGELPSRLSLVATGGAVLAVGTIAALGNAVPAVGVLGGVALVGVVLVLVDLYVESTVVNRELTRDGESTAPRHGEE